MAILGKIIEACRLGPQSAYALYFDTFRADPERLSRMGRGAIRDAYFGLRNRGGLPAVDLIEWLSRVTQGVPPAITLPVDIANDGVGTALYFHALAAVCAAVRPKQIVEFGTFLGLGTSSMAMNCEGRILTIDLPEDAKGEDVETLNASDMDLVKMSRRKMGSHYKGKAFESRITELRGDSRQLDLTEHVSTAEVCLVDGGHSTDCVKADTENSFKVIAKGGIIIWDDYFWLYPDVVNYLDDLATQGRELVRIRGTHLVAYAHPG